MDERQGFGDDVIVVKFMAKKLTPATTPAWRRQVPDGQCPWGRCRFEFDQDCQIYDWLVAYDDLSPVAGKKFPKRIQPLACFSENTMLVTAEPSCIKTYGSDFVEQFGVVVTSQIEPDVCISIREIAETLVEISGKGINIEYDRSKPEGDRGRCADYSKARRILGWQPRVSLHEGLEETYRWVETRL